MVYAADSYLCNVYSTFLAGFSLVQTDYPKGTCSFCCRINQRQDVRFLLYTKYNPHHPQYLYLNDIKSLYNSNFRFDFELKIYIHEFGESINDPQLSTVNIKDAFLTLEKTMVIVIDWSQLGSTPWFIEAIQNIPIVGYYVAEFIQFLIYSNFPLFNIHLVGYGLGAHICGFVGTILVEWEIHLAIITALDPFYNPYPRVRFPQYLNPSVASFVEVIHTSNAPYQSQYDTGHADFYINNGVDLQPGCRRQNIRPGDWLGIVSCNHIRAWLYYVDSIRYKHSFRADHCTPSSNFPQCVGSNATMGTDVDVRLRGRFFLETNSLPPYGKHSEGPAKVQVTKG